MRNNNNPKVTYEVVEMKDINFEWSPKPLREYGSQELDLQSLDILEKVTDISLEKSKNIIKVLDNIAPNRINNCSLLSWRTWCDWSLEDKKGKNKLFERTYGGLIAMIEDIIHITSFYAPELCRTMVTEINETSYFYKELPKDYASEERDTRMRDAQKFSKQYSMNCLKEVSERIGIKNYKINQDLFDEFICVGELMHFYCDKLLEDDTPEKEILKKQWGCLILSLLDVFGKFNYDLKTDFLSFCFKEVSLPFDVREKVKKNKFLFTTMSSNLTTIN